MSPIGKIARFGFGATLALFPLFCIANEEQFAPVLDHTGNDGEFVIVVDLPEPYGVTDIHLSQRDGRLIRLSLDSNAGSVVTPVKYLQGARAPHLEMTAVTWSKGQSSPNEEGSIFIAIHVSHGETISDTGSYLKKVFVFTENEFRYVGRVYPSAYWERKRAQYNWD